MNFYILGKDSHDKGSQLEQLASRLLKKYEFQNIVRNEIGSGGHEIDIRADYNIRSINGNNIKPIICECKAYKDPVAMTDWLKFLGKILIEESNGKNVDAYFIALNGINGNVSGNYRDLSQKRDNIKLITGETLVRELEDVFYLKPIDKIQQNIEKLTLRKPIEICFCYYNMQIIYLIGFSQSEFSLLSNTGNIIEGIRITELNNLIQLNTDYSNYIDLNKESIGLQRKERIKKMIMAFLLSSKNAVKTSRIHSFTKANEKELTDIKPIEIKVALNELVHNSIVIEKQNSYSLRIIEEKTDMNFIADFYKALFKSTTPSFVFGCENYDKLIDENLLNYICKVQGGLKLDELNSREILQIIKLSPSALLRALVPDEMIVNHRSQGIINDSLNKEDVLYFLQKLCALLAEDFKNKNLSKYFLELRKIVEMETNNRIILKNSDKIVLDMNHRERLFIGQTSEEDNNLYVIVRLLNDQPEPWERNKQIPV